MGYDYDKLYRDTPEALGDPTGVLVEGFRAHLPPSALVLDAGCGQGRDALPLAREGHRVVGVDLSPKGVADMVSAAEADGLPVTGVVADLVAYAPDGVFDALVFDRTLHMLSESDRHAVLARCLGHLRSGGVLFLADEPGNMAGFHEVLAVAGGTWETLLERRGYLVARRG